ncbi:hypothetical protein U1Q18_004829 [Sarracenia purpurea var. burkii]
MAAAALGFPFTSAQWKELERQAMIYKYMMASIPVPPELLLPISRTDSTSSRSSLGNGSAFQLNLGFSKSKDLEPGRCKRTDGKKWRCSRDVAPLQKYCERHLHKGRPRSRKLVEVESPINTAAAAAATSKKSRLHHHTLPPIPTTTLSKPKAHTNISSNEVLGSTIQPNNETPLFLNETDENLSVNSSYEEPTRGFDWAMEGEMLTLDSSDQQWQNLLQTNEGMTPEGSILNIGDSVFRQNCIEMPLIRLPILDFGGPEIDQQNGQCTLFLNPETEVACLEKQSQLDEKNGSSVSSLGSLSPCSLTLSMAMTAGDSLDDEIGQIQMGLGVSHSERHEPRVSSWLCSVSSASSASAPGGPLAEMLRPSSVANRSSEVISSSFACNGVATSTRASRVSPAHGVLQRTSPTVDAPTATPEITPFLWLN